MASLIFPALTFANKDLKAGIMAKNVKLLKF
jgi:hypothetical protein